jgi:RNA polymerase sigma factor (sigma-70 family)
MNQSSLKEEFLQNFDTYSDAIFRFCLVKTSNKELAEDLTQEAFMRYWQAVQDGKVMHNVRSFLYTVASNLVIDWYRKKKALSLSALEENGFEAQDTAVTGVLENAEFTQILETIADLEEKDKEVLLLRFVEGLDPKDIAVIIDESANVVSVRINRAIEKVQKKLHV